MLPIGGWQNSTSPLENIMSEWHLDFTKDLSFCSITSCTDILQTFGHWGACLQDLYFRYDIDISEGNLIQRGE